MDSPMKKPSGKKKEVKGKYEKPISLYGMSFDDVVAHIIKPKPAKAKRKK
jgi:hypothetical protein